MLADMEPRISLVTLGVTDLARARAFYEQLGWSVHSAPGGDIAFFQAGAMAFALWGRAELAADCALSDDGPAFGAIALAHNVSSPFEVDAIVAAAEAAGATVRRAPAATDWGGYSGVFTDPDGHPWEIAHNPFWTLNPDGSISL
jgi:catechol 2,3-dioxygenase-like lactoylglutathione lyase family enzyme